MRLHPDARSCPQSRLLMVRRVEEEGWRPMRAAEAASVSVRTLSRWLRCYRRDGEEGLLDRSSVPRLISHRTPEQRLGAIAALRWLRLRAAQSGEALSRLEPEPAKRYERRGDGQLLHTGVVGRPGRPGDRVNGDRRTTRRGIGWELVHVCVDDTTRLADVEVGEEEKATSAVGLLRRALAQRARDPHRAGDGRQRLRLRLDRARARLQDARDQTPAHPPLPSAHERQSRALHPHPARRLGLRRHLGQLPRAAPRPHRLARLLQSTPTTRLP